MHPQFLSFSHVRFGWGGSLKDKWTNEFRTSVGVVTCSIGVVCAECELTVEQEMVGTC